MGNRFAIPLPGPSSAYFICGTNITNLDGSVIVLNDAGIQTIIFQVLAGCENPT